MAFLSVVIGAILGAWVGSFDRNAFSSMVLGAIVAWLFARHKTWQDKLAQLQQLLAAQKNAFDQDLARLRARVYTLENPENAPPDTEQLAPAPIAEAAPSADIAPDVESVVLTQDMPAPASQLEAQTIAASSIEMIDEESLNVTLPAESTALNEGFNDTPKYTTPIPTRPAKPDEPNLIERAFFAAKAWLFGGNTLVRMGIVLVFLGMAFLLRYASDRVVVPVELRYIGVAIATLVGLGLGWRLRESRRAYGLLMQGAAVAVMYLTIFSAMRLHAILPMQAGFVLLVLVAVFAAILAVTQDAPGLAMAGSLGGFAAPILASTGGGSHIALFSYFALLNTGILAIAWFKAWRPLNLVGFFCTFGIGLAWGWRSYQPEHYASTQAFLILFFLMFVGIGLLFARRVLLDADDAPAEIRSGAWFAWLGQQALSKRYVDGTMLFGPPLVGFGLQYALVSDTAYGTAFASLALGLFYMVLARTVMSRTQASLRLLVEVFLALGVIFASLAIPLGLDAQWTTAAWAVEAAGIYWIGHRQGRAVGRGFALLLQGGAIISWLIGMEIGDATLLDGPVLGTLLIGLALLCNAYSLRIALLDEGNAQCWDRKLRPVFSTLGLWFLYLIAPQLLGAQGTAVAWSLAGLATVLIGLRMQARGWLVNSLLVQLLAGVVFLFDMQTSGAGDALGVLAVSGSAWRGLMIASLVGAAALVSVFVAIRAARIQRNPQMEHRMGWLMLFGLGFMALAALFVLPWESAAGVWAGSGFVVLVLAIWLALRPAFWFALALQVFAGITYLIRAVLAFNYAPVLASEQLAAFSHSGFWTPAIIAVAAFLVSWRLAAYAQRELQEGDLTINGAWFALPALIWSALWWSFAWGAELSRLLPDQETRHVFLVVIALTVLLWNRIARKQDWSAPVWLGSAVLPLTMLVVLLDYAHHSSPFATWGWLACALVVAAHLYALSHDDLLSEGVSRIVHLLGVWTGLLVLSLQARYWLLALAEPGSAWRWLGWVLPLLVYLFWSARQSEPQRWPASAQPALYRYSATFPVLMILWLWLGLSALKSVGNPAPLPFIPLMNPLEIAQVLVVLGSVQWLRSWSDNQDETPYLALLRPLLWPLLMVLAFVVYSMAVLRANHYFGGVEWQWLALQRSMAVQTSLSIAWSLLALGLMIMGHRSVQRLVWIIGAVLVAVVVLKLFLVELSNQGGLERIVSFIGVGILLLVVGYFAPLPPSVEEKE